MMSELFKRDDYDPTAWRDFGIYETIPFLYVWAVEICDKVANTKAAKELLEMVKNVEFDVIVQDITLDECLFGLWEVDITRTVNNIQTIFSKLHNIIKARSCKEKILFRVFDFFAKNHHHPYQLY